MQDPKPGDILKKTNLTAYPALIGEAGAASFFREDRFIQFNTQQRPRTGTEKSTTGFIHLCRRNRINSACRIVRTDSYDIHFIRQTNFFSNLPFQFATYRTGHHNVSEEMCRYSQAMDEWLIPSPTTCIKQFGGGCNAVFIICHPCEEVTEKIGHKQKTVCNFQLRITAFLHAVKLKKCIDGHHLYAGFGIMPNKIAAEKLLRQTIRSGITITHRISQQITVTVYQSKVHTPGINANAPDMISLAHRLPESVLHLIKQSQKIPVHMVSHPHLAVWKAVHLFQFQRTLADGTGHNTTASTSKIYCQIGIHHLVFFPKMYVSRSSISSGVSTV